MRLSQPSTEMAFKHQTDKEFSVNGRITRPYMDCPRMNRFAVKRETLSKIILDGGEKELGPERRFDQTVYYTIAEMIKQGSFCGLKYFGKTI